MLNIHKAKQCGAGLETTVSAPRRSGIVSGPGMCVTKVTVLQNKSEALPVKVHKPLQSCFRVT